jgi:hypothetical protein
MGRSAGSYWERRSAFGQLMSNRSWHHNCRRRGQPRRIHVYYLFDTVVHNPLYVVDRIALPQMI